jgi:uncharacterized protein with ATP-grasp and redox domains
MNTNLDCIPCIVNSFQSLLKSSELPDVTKQSAMRRLLAFLSGADYKLSPPAMGREMHRIIRRELNNPDPYQKIKEKNNQMMMDMYSDFKEMVRVSADPFDTAMRLAVAGNVIDFGPQHQFDFMETINKVLHAEFAIDDSKKLKSDIESANTILYIGDNCGEIVLDKLFLETIRKQKMYFAVRSGPVINDATIDDAKKTGINSIANIITTGDDSPGVVWEYTSRQFKQIFKQADVIISKGQGNLEGLMEVAGNIYFLLITKCELIGNHVGTRQGEFVVKKSPLLKK